MPCTLPRSPAPLRPPANMLRMCLTLLTTMAACMADIVPLPPAAVAAIDAVGGRAAIAALRSAQLCALAQQYGVDLAACKPGGGGRREVVGRGMGGRHAAPEATASHCDWCGARSVPAGPHAATPPNPPSTPPSPTAPPSPHPRRGVFRSARATARTPRPRSGPGCPRLRALSGRRRRRVPAPQR